MGLARPGCPRPRSRWSPRGCWRFWLKSLIRAHRSAERGHGREEIRELRVASVNGLLFPHAQQVVRIRRRSRPLGAKKWAEEIVYAVTDLPAEQATPDENAAWTRDHWTIENSVH
jgi:hypothetical protein